MTKYYLGETTGFPFDLKTQNVGKMDCVVPVTLSSNVIKLHQFLFGTENYQPSSHVTRISEDIAYNSAKSADSGEQINQEDIEKMSESYKENADKPDEEEGAVSRETDADGESRDGEEAESEESAAEPETDEDGKIIEKPEPETDEDGRIIEKPDHETEEGEHPGSNSDEYVPEDELINDPNHAIMVPTVPGGKPGTTKPGTTGSEEATNPGTTGSEETTKPGTTDNGATTKPGTSDSGEPTKPGTGTKPGTADSGETTKPGTTKPGTQQTTESDEGFGPGHVNAPGSLEEEVSPGPGQSTSGPSGTVHTNRPASAGTETTAGEHGPGFTG